MSGVQITIYAGQENSATINIRDGNGLPIDFTNATRFVAQHFAKNPANNFTVDTDSDAGTIVGDADGNITFLYAGLAVTEDDYIVRLTVYDPEHVTTGQDLAHECCGPLLCMKICGTVAAVTTVPGLYFEVEVTDNTNVDGNPWEWVIGVTNTTEGPDVFLTGTTDPSLVGFWGLGVEAGNDPVEIDNGVVGDSFSTEFGNIGDIMRVCVNESGDMWIGRHRGGTTTWYGGGDPSTGTSPLFTGITGDLKAYILQDNRGF